MTVFRAHIRDGQLDFGSHWNTQRFKQWCAENEGKAVRIEHEVPVRSMSQHRFYFCYLQILAHHTGYSVAELHAWAKKKFLPPTFATVMGEEVMIEPSTRTLTKAQFGELLEAIAQETEVPLPNPEDAGYLPG